MSAIEVPCTGCGATSYDFCVCSQVDQIEAGLAGESFYSAARVLRRLGSSDLHRVVSTLQYRAQQRGYRDGREDGRRSNGEGRD
jgi:hypothetical protein